MNDIELFFALLAGHFVADYPLQNDFIADNKGKAFVSAQGFYTLTAHSATQGLIAGLISQNFTVGLIIAITHWIIDFGKKSVLLTDKFPHTKGSRKNGQKVGLYGINVDQALHILVILVVVTFVV